MKKGREQKRDRPVRLLYRIMALALAALLVPAPAADRAAVLAAEHAAGQQEAAGGQDPGLLDEEKGKEESAGEADTEEDGTGAAANKAARSPNEEEAIEKEAEKGEDEAGSSGAAGAGAPAEADAEDGGIGTPAPDRAGTADGDEAAAADTGEGGGAFAAPGRPDPPDAENAGEEDGEEEGAGTDDPRNAAPAGAAVPAEPGAAGTENAAAPAEPGAAGTENAPAPAEPGAAGMENAAGAAAPLSFSLEGLSAQAGTYRPGDESPVSTDELPASKYTPGYFFKYFNLICFGDAINCNECMGGILIQGNYGSQNGTQAAFACEIAAEPSYVAGFLAASNGNDGANNRHVENPPADVFVGPSNTVSADGKNLNKSGVGGAEGFNRNGLVYINENYVDWAAVKKLFTDASDSWRDASTQTIDLTGKNWDYQENRPGKALQIQAGSNVTLTGLTQQYARVYVEITGSAENGTVINVAGSGKVPLPIIYRADGQDLQVSESGGKMSFIFNFPDASEVYVPSGNAFGNIVAPNAKITVEGGNYNGTLVGASLDVSAEGHMWVYSGSDIQDEPDEPPEPERNCTLLLWKTLDYKKQGAVTGSVSQLPDDIGFIIEGPGGYRLDIKLSDSRFYDYFYGKELRLDNLEPGDYTVTEYGGGKDGFIHRAVYHAIARYDTRTDPTGSSETGNTVTVSEKQAGSSGYTAYEVVAKMWIDNIYEEKPREYLFAKVDEGGDLIGGAQLALLKWEKMGSHREYTWPWRKVDDYEWMLTGDVWATVAGEKKTIENLPDGDYLLRELSAPDGYEKAEDIPFSISGGVMKDGSGQPVTGSTITMVDHPVPHTAVVMPQTGVLDRTGQYCMGAGLLVFLAGILRLRHYW